LPSVNQLYQEFRNRGFEVLLVSFRESPGLVRAEVQQRRYTAPVLLDESGDVTGRIWGVWAPPTFYLIDRRGQLVGRGVGARAWDSPQARALIESLVAEKPER
jgi:hypothetical protein